MTILPKKKKEGGGGGKEGGEQQQGESDDSRNSSHGGSHSSHGSPHPPDEEVAYHQSPEGFYHRRYDLSSSSDDSSPEMPPAPTALNKRVAPHHHHRSPPSSASAASGARGGKKPPPDSSPYHSGYNSSEEYDGGRRPYVDVDLECKFEQALKGERGFVIKKMRADGACLFRAVADQVYGDQEMHIVVRNNCMDYMLKNADYFSQYVTEDFEHYIDRKRAEQCYGNNIEMQAIAEMYNRSIEVFQYSTEPINIFFGVYKTDNAPIRLSYHAGVHYNSVVNPFQATIGVGLGLAGHKPGLADKVHLGEAMRDSENVQIEKTILHEKLRSSDWEATCDAIEEAVARESYLSWLREHERREHTDTWGTQSTSAACGGSSLSSFHRPPLPPPITTTPLPPPPTTSSSSSSSSSSSAPGMSLKRRGSPLHKPSPTANAKSSEAKLGKSRSALLLHSGSSPTRSSSRRNSPPAAFTYRTLSGQHSALRSSPYHTPRESPRGSLRGTPRTSPRGSPTYSSGHNSPRTSPRNSVHGSPPLLPSPTTAAAAASRPTSAEPSGGSKPLSPPSPHQQNRGESPSGFPGRAGSGSPVEQRFLESAPPPPSPAPLESPPSHSLDFESGKVLSQLPYEYSSFLDLPPSALGLSEWEDDRLLAAVLAASQQEYLDSLRQGSRGAGGGAEGGGGGGGGGHS